VLPPVLQVLAGETLVSKAAPGKQTDQAGGQGPPAEGTSQRRPKKSVSRQSFVIRLKGMY